MLSNCLNVNLAGITAEPFKKLFHTNILLYTILYYFISISLQVVFFLDDHSF